MEQISGTLEKSRMVLTEKLWSLQFQSLSIVTYGEGQLYLIIVLRIYNDMGQEQEVTPNMRLSKSVIGF